MIAIVGAGLAGLSAAFFLSQKGYKITLFDKDGIGKGASGIASGLCHPYPGRDGKLSKYGHESLEETKALLSYVEEKTKTRCAHKISFLRKNLPLTLNYPDLEETPEGILIHSGVVFAMPLYLESLFQTIPNLTFIQKKVSFQDDFAEFDAVIFAMGWGFQEEKSLPFQYIKGQSLLAKSSITWERPILGNGHLIPLSDHLVLLGSTYEHHFENDLPDLEKAKKSLAPRLSSFLPFSTFEICKASAGIRVTQKGSYLPIIEKIGPNKFLFTGLGSRGLLYHARYGRLLADRIFS